MPRKAREGQQNVDHAPCQPDAACLEPGHRLGEGILGSAALSAQRKSLLLNKGFRRCGPYRLRRHHARVYSPVVLRNFPRVGESHASDVPPGAL